MSQSYQTLVSETDEQGITTLTVNRPDKLNALNDQVLNELADFFKDVQVDEKVRGVIVTGAGDKAFVAGADIKELRELSHRTGRMASQKGQQIFQLIEDTRKPVVAAVNGYALGGGAELAMACHLRMANENAVFGLPEVGLGLIPGYGGTQRLAKIIGKGRALELVLSAKKINAEEAYEWGLVNKITDSAVEAARDFTHSVLENGPVAIQSAIKAVYHSDHPRGFQVEADLFGELCDTEDFLEGTSAFLEKRKPKFEGK